MKKILLLGLVLFCLPLATWGQAGAGFITKQSASSDLAIWYPLGGLDHGPYPLVVFSHGYRGCNVQTLYFTEELARQGYVVVAPNHHDGRCAESREGELSELNAEKFSEVEKWDEQTYFDRRQDLVTAINQALEENVTPTSPIYKLINPNQIGAAGHSLGGYSALGLAGARSTWHDARVKAVVAFSAFIGPYTLSDALSKIKVPVMYQAGTLDKNGRIADQVYDLTSSPKVSMVLKAATHLAWSNVLCLRKNATECLATNQRAQTINRFAISFFDRYLKGDVTAEKDFTTKTTLIDSLQFDLTNPKAPSESATTTPETESPTSSRPILLLVLLIVVLFGLSKFSARVR